MKEAPDVYESLDSLKMASSALMPPFKTVSVKIEEPSLKKSIVSETICNVTDNDQANPTLLINADSRIREIIAENGQVAIRPTFLKQEEAC